MGSDEVALMMLLNVLRAIVILPIGDSFTDEAVCEVIQVRLPPSLYRAHENDLFKSVETITKT